MTSEYSKVFEQLVNTKSEDQDLVGLLAYALYKQKKRNWVIRFKEDKTKSPSEDDERFFESTHGEEDFNSFRGQAETLLVAYSDSVLEDATPSIKEQTLKDHILQQAKEVLLEAKNQNSPWHSIWTGIVGSFIFSALLALMALIAGVNGSDLLNALNSHH